MSKPSSIIKLGSEASQKTIKSKESLGSKKSKLSSSFVSEHGSKFGRSVSKFPKKNDPGLVLTLSTVNSRVIRTVFNPSVQINSKVPDLTQIEATKCIRELGQYLNILDYEYNYASFWLLDTLAKSVKGLQLKDISNTDQNIFLTWFRFGLRSIAVTGASREEIFQLFQEMFKEAVKTIQDGKPTPEPEEIKIKDNTSISPKVSSELHSLLSKKLHSGSIISKRKRQSSRKSSQKSLNASSKLNRTSSRHSSQTSSNSIINQVEVNLKNFYRIIELIYEVFADRFVFTMVHLTFSSPSIIQPEEIAVTFNDLKPPKPEPIIPPAVNTDSPKSKSPKGGKKEKGKKKVSVDEKGKKKNKQSLTKGKKSRASSLEKKDSLEAKIKLFDRTISPEIEAEKEQICTKDCYILPLTDAVDENYAGNLVRSLLPKEIPVAELKQEISEDKNVAGRKKSSLGKKKSPKAKKNK